MNASMNSKIGNKQKAVIHIAKAQLGLTEVEYRSLLQAEGVTSSKDLTQSLYYRLLIRLKGLGFVIKSKKPKRHTPPKSTEKMIWKIERMSEALNLSDNYINAIAKRVCGVSSYRFADPDGLRKIIAALTYHQKRQESN